MRKWQACLQCGGQVKKERALYCSDACKMKAYRRRLDPLAGSSISTKERIRQSVRTKSSMTVEMACAQCGQVVIINGLEALRDYCSNACKQKAYRSRQKEKSALPMPDHAKYSSGAIHQQKYLLDMSDYYRKKHGRSWIYEGGKIDFRNASYWVDVDGRAYHIGGIYMVRRYFETYAISGHPIDSMPRVAAPARPAQNVQTERVAFSPTTKKVTTLPTLDAELEDDNENPS